MRLLRRPCQSPVGGEGRGDLDNAEIDAAPPQELGRKPRGERAGDQQIEAQMAELGERSIVGPICAAAAAWLSRHSTRKARRTTSDAPTRTWTCSADVLRRRAALLRRGRGRRQRGSGEPSTSGGRAQPRRTAPALPAAAWARIGKLTWRLPLHCEASLGTGRGKPVGTCFGYALRLHRRMSEP